jgi:branched-chain amino acid transport system permease protein
VNTDLLVAAVVNGLMLSAVYALVALGLTVVFGLLDIVNFAHGQMILIGAYLAVSLVSHSVNFWVAMVIAVVVVAALGALLERVVFRPVESVPINGLLVSIGLIAIGQNVIHAVWGPNQLIVPPPISFVWRVGGATIPMSRVVIVIGTVIVLAGLSLFLYRTRAGKALRATAQNRDAAALVGIPVATVNNLAFAAGAGLAAVAGAFLAMQFPVEPLLADSPLVMGFIVLILGGAGSPLGAVLGAVVIGLTESVCTALVSSEAAQIVPFVILAVILFVRPEGIVRIGGDRWV